MYRIIIYSDRKGKAPLLEYIEELRTKKDKSSRIKSEKMIVYMNLLKEYGTNLGSNIIKHLDGEIWELRPIQDRVLFAAVFGDAFVLLHSFTKKTQKTPQSEIERAKRELADFKCRFEGGAEEWLS